MKKWKDKVSLKIWQVIVVLIVFLLIFGAMLGVIIWQNNEIKKVLPTYTIQSLDVFNDENDERGYGMLYTPIRGPDYRWTVLSRNYTESIMEVLSTREFRECGGWDFYIDKEYKTKQAPQSNGFRYFTTDGTKYNMALYKNYIAFQCDGQLRGYYTMEHYAEFRQWIRELSVWITRPEGAAPEAPAILLETKQS